MGTAPNGCDVLDVLNLTFYSDVDTMVTMRVCDSLSWRNGDGVGAVDSVYKVSTTLEGTSREHLFLETLDENGSAEYKSVLNQTHQVYFDRLNAVEAEPAPKEAGLATV